MDSKQIAIEFLKKHEGCKLEAYRDIAGVWTIGYGYTLGIKKGMKWTQETADIFLSDLVSKLEIKVVNKVGNLDDHKIAALISFVYNLGYTAFCNSTLLSKIKFNENDPAIETEFKKWIYAGGKMSKGLLNRRQAEVDLYFRNII